MYNCKSIRLAFHCMMANEGNWCRWSKQDHVWGTSTSTSTSPANRNFADDLVKAYFWVVTGYRQILWCLHRGSHPRKVDKRGPPGTSPATSFTKSGKRRPWSARPCSGSHSAWAHRPDGIKLQTQYPLEQLPGPAVKAQFHIPPLSHFKRNVHP